MIRRQRTNSDTNSTNPRSSLRKSAGAGGVLPSDQFQAELSREIDRSNFRSEKRDVGLIRMRFREFSPAKFPETEAFGQCVARLRVNDLVGWYDSTISFLLPECDRDGTVVVANELTQICIDSGMTVDADVSIYPMDDDLISLANELQPGYRPIDEEEWKATEESSDSLTAVDNGVGEGSWSGAEPGEDQVERFDLPHSSNHLAMHRSGNSGSVALVNEQIAASPAELFTSSQGRVRLMRHRFILSKPTPWWKRGIDILGAGTGLLLLSPVFLIAAVAIKVSSRGPVFFRQLREGKDGKHFGILKFRTMVVDAEQLQEKLRDRSEQDGPAFKLKDDPRVTGVGRYLRKSCVDELPQLINVLLGQMSLVGPRPLPVSESLACTAWQRVRLTVLPGLTCTWQVHGGRDVKFSEWMQMDLDYIKNQSFLGDLRLIFETAVIALLHRGSV